MSVNVNDIIVLKPKLAEIIKAKTFSKKKWKYIKDTFVSRNKAERYLSVQKGDIAKIVVKRWLKSNGLKVVDWDEKRPSWKSNRKPYDLQVNNCNIEIASSKSKFSGMQENDILLKIIKKEHIIQPVRITPKNIVLQVFYLSQKNHTMYIFGWALWNDLKKFPKLLRMGKFYSEFWMVPFNSNKAIKPLKLVNVLKKWK